MCFLKSEGRCFTPNSASNSCPIWLIRAASLWGLMERVVVKVKAVLGGVLGGAAHPEPVADGAAAAPLRLVFQPGDGRIELLRVVGIFDNRHAQWMSGGYKAFQLLPPAVVLGGGPGVGVVVENGNLKELAELLQNGTGTGAAAGVEQELGSPGERFQHFVHLLCKIQLF